MKSRLLKGTRASVSLLFLLMIHCFARSEAGRSIQETELPLVIVTSSYNNAPWVIKYLDSIFTQEYDNYRLIYIDDCSDDGTANIVQSYVDWHGLQEQVTVIKNNVRRLKLENIYKVIHGCNDFEIVVILDGDDWFAHTRVLQEINQAYLNQDVWFTYSQSKFFPTGGLEPIAKEVPLSVLENRNFRKWDWVYRHPRTFYAWLFKLIKLKDLLTNAVPGFEGKFYPFCNDRAMIYPMLEMAQHCIRYIPGISVIQNKLNPVPSLDKNNQIEKLKRVKSTCHRETVNKSIQYPALKKSVTNRLAQYASSQADCLILSENNPEGLSHFLDTIEEHVQGVDKYCVIYQADDHVFSEEYLALQRNYSHIQFYCVPITSEQLVSILKQLKQKHIILLSDTKVFNQVIDCAYAIYEMESAYAYIFDTSVSTQLLDRLGIPYQHIGNGLFAWKFACDKKNSLKVHSFNGSLYKKIVIRDAFLNASCSSLSQLQVILESTSIDTNNVGLFVSIPNDKSNHIKH